MLEWLEANESFVLKCTLWLRALMCFLLSHLLSNYMISWYFEKKKTPGALVFCTKLEKKVSIFPAFWGTVMVCQHYWRWWRKNWFCVTKNIKKNVIKDLRETWTRYSSIVIDEPTDDKNNERWLMWWLSNRRKWFCLQMNLEVTVSCRSTFHVLSKYFMLCVACRSSRNHSINLFLFLLLLCLSSVFAKAFSWKPSIRCEFQMEDVFACQQFTGSDRLYLCTLFYHDSAD